MNEPTAHKKSTQDLQNTFYDDLMQKKAAVNLYLVNGIRLSGTITATDKYTILMSNSRANSTPQLVYKAAISTVSPA